MTSWRIVLRVFLKSGRDYEPVLLYGVAKQRNSDALQLAVTGFLKKIQILSWGSTEAAVYGQLRAKQQAAGHTLGPMDLLIAAHAVAQNAMLVTSDKVFKRLPDLAKNTVNWATDI